MLIVNGFFNSPKYDKLCKFLDVKTDEEIVLGIASRLRTEKRGQARKNRIKSQKIEIKIKRSILWRRRGQAKNQKKDMKKKKNKRRTKKMSEMILDIALKIN